MYVCTYIYIGKNYIYSNSKGFSSLPCLITAIRVDDKFKSPNGGTSLAVRGIFAGEDPLFGRSLPC